MGLGAICAAGALVATALHEGNTPFIDFQELAPVAALAQWQQTGDPAVLASVVLTTLPILILYVIGRRQLLSGLTAGFSK